MHYSRIMPVVNGERYFTSTAVFLNEVIKLLICVGVVLHDKAVAGKPWSLAGLWNEVFGGDAWKLMIPAALYTVPLFFCDSTYTQLQNNLQYVAVSNLDAATFQVTYQLKILTTALFSVTLLQRQLSVQKWGALVLLTFGVALVQLPTSAPSPPPEQSEMPRHFSFARAFAQILQPRDQYDESMNRTIGLAAVFAACLLSGLAGVYFEKVLKGSSATLWVRNVQLSFFSLFPAFFVGVLWKDGTEVFSKVFLIWE
jgi:UDP-galactose transporter